MFAGGTKPRSSAAWAIANPNAVWAATMDAPKAMFAWGLQARNFKIQEAAKCHVP